MGHPHYEWRKERYGLAKWYAYLKKYRQGPGRASYNKYMRKYMGLKAMSYMEQYFLANNKYLKLAKDQKCQDMNLYAPSTKQSAKKTKSKQAL